MDRLDLTLQLARRDFALDLTLGVGAEVLALVGPSGAGKSSLIRAIAGLDRPDNGHIVLGERVLFDSASGVDLPPQQRHVGVVFQDLALFPHMSVAANVAYGGGGQVDELLARFGIGHLAAQRPDALSGGERQRVALARALAARPEVLLMDEPLSALDPATRGRVRTELADLLAGLSIPVILVTHDFDDALVLADRVGVMADGRLRQIGTPQELVAAPVDAFVAQLTGVNLLSGHACPGPDGLTAVTLDDGTQLLSTDRVDGPVNAVIAPWDVTVARSAPDAGSARNQLTGRVGSVVRFANRVRIQVGPLVAEVTGAAVDVLGLQTGDPAVATIKATAIRLVRRGEEDGAREAEPPR